MRKYLILSAALFGMSYLGHAQVGIGTKNPSESTVLDMQAEDRGVLFPRVHLKALNELSPVKGTLGDMKIKGLIVFNINPNLEDKDLKGKSEGFYVWSGMSWNRLSTRSEVLELIKEIDNSDINAVLNLLINQTKPGDPFKGTSVVLYDFEKEEFYTLVKDDKGNVVKSEKIDLTNAIRKAETKSLVNRGEVKVDGQAPEVKESLTYDQTKLKKGQIFYEYLGEKRDKDGKQIPYYLDITGDVKNVVNNNEEVRKIFEDIVNKFLTEGGNVFFGDHDDDQKTDDVLYAYVENRETGKKEKKVINLGENFRELLKNEHFTKEIRDAIGYDITEKAVTTGNKVKGKMIYIFAGLTYIEDLNAETGGVILPAEFANKSVDIFDIQLFDKNGTLEKTGITDVEVRGGKVNFSLGAGGFYTTLPKGEYKAVIQFVEK
jgi:hypothetical protein